MGEIKSTDLRAGNLVLHNKQIFEIYDIISTQDSVVIGQGDDTGGFQEVFISEISAIDISEEILLKSGFEENDFSHVYEDDTRFSVYVNDGFFFCQIDDVVIIVIGCLHELQNLYFSFTGQELKIQL